MAKKIETIKRSLLIGSLSLIGIIIVLLIINCFYIYKDNKSLINRNEELLNIYQEKENILEDINNNIHNKNEVLKEYEYIEKTTTELKEEYFDLIVSLEQDIINDQTDLKIAYITIDDGPYYLSEKFLDVFDEYDIPVTYFYLMKSTETGYDEQDEFYDSIYRRIIESGHTLGNHTSTHKFGANGIYSSLDAFKKAVLDNKEFIYNRYAYTSEVFRFPGGSGTPSNNKTAMIEFLVSEGYGYVDWNVSTGDGSLVALSPSQYRDNVLNNTAGKDILVILMHDYSRNTLAALPEIIEGLQVQGYIFLPLSNKSIVAQKQ